MSNIKLKKVSNWLFYMGILVGGLGYYKIYKVRKLLPPGVCPINDNRWILFIGIFLLLTSVVVSYLDERKG